MCVPELSTTLPERLPFELRPGGLSVELAGSASRRRAPSSEAGASRPGALTDQVPAPPPASLSTIVRVSLCPARSRPNETPAGAAKSPGASAACTSIMPPPCASTLVGCWCFVSLKTGRPVSTSADLICAGVQVGWRSRSSAAAPATAGVAMLVPDQVP